jgi:hypothetical protein
VTSENHRRLRSVTSSGVLVAIVAGIVALALGQSAGSGRDAPLSRARIEAFEEVTIFGIVVTSDHTTIDPKLSNVESELRKFQPGHGFKLKAHNRKRLVPGESLDCDMGGGIVAKTELVGVEPNGKLRLKFSLFINGKMKISSFVTTPPNQLFFCEKKLSNGEHLLIGVAAR